MEWLQKNAKYIIITLLILLFFKSCQSCNRDGSAKHIQKEYKHVKDSLSSEITVLNDSIKGLHYKLQLANIKETSANERANAVQKTAETIKQNTTIKIENKTQEPNNSKNK
jgi:regulatory protein YycI of two-component signal transduction system YycFG